MSTDTTPKTKRCTNCDKRKRIHLFSQGNSWCKQCVAEYSAKRRKTDKKKLTKDRWHARTYQRALSVLADNHREEFDELVARIRAEDPYVA